MGEVMPKKPIKLHIIAPKNPSIYTHMHTQTHTGTHTPNPIPPNTRFLLQILLELTFFDNTVTSMIPTNETEVHNKYVVSI